MESLIKGCLGAPSTSHAKSGGEYAYGTGLGRFTRFVPGVWGEEVTDVTETSDESMHTH